MDDLGLLGQARVCVCPFLFEKRARLCNYEPDMISIVFPAYNEEGNVAELHRRIVAAMKRVPEPYEILAVNNASSDRTREELLKLAPVRIISLAHNIGQTAGLDAGIHAAKGDIIVTIDADLQNDPDDIPAMIEKLREGYDMVTGWRKDRRDSFGRRVLSRSANWLTSKVTGIHLHDYACALKVFKKKYMEGIHLYGEMHVFLPAILASRGARIAEMQTLHHERFAGVSKHFFMKAVKDIADLMTVKFLFTYAARPLVFFGGWGIGSIFIGFLSGTASLILKIADVRNIGQTPLPIIAALFIILGVILFMMGFIAELMLRIYYEGRKETPYTISEVIENERGKG